MESIEKALTKLYRKRAAKKVYAAMNNTVKYGPFAGLKFSGGSHISDTSLALKALGLYETEVVDHLLSLTTCDALINLGAGDGYFPVAMARAGYINKALAFEMNEEGRRAIAANAALNGVAEQIAIHGAADANLTATLAALGVEPAKTMVLCDIEGAEYDVLDQALIDGLAAAHFVIELHPFMVADGEARESAMAARFSATHDVSIIKAQPRDWRDLEEVEALHDLERALVTSEGRKLLARWMIATPRVRT
ncbi:MAG: hypothetical protein WA921_00305 [Ahrensia sp.]